MSWLNRPPAQGLIATGLSNPSVFARNGLLLSVNAKRDYGASGSSQSTTGTMAAASTTLTLAAALDFVNGQGIAIANAGPVPSLTVPGAPTVTVVGASGTSSYYYSIAALDGLGGGTAAGPGAGVTTGPAVLSATNYVSLTWAAVAGVSLYGIWRYESTGSPNTVGLIAITSATSLEDIGLPILAPPLGMASLPATAPSTSFADNLLTSIASGAGTTTLTLANASTTAVSGGVVQHDDTQALINMFAYALPLGQSVHIPLGWYRVNKQIEIDLSKIPKTLITLGGGLTSHTGGFGVYGDPMQTILDASNMLIGVPLLIHATGGTTSATVSTRGNVFEDLWVIGQTSGFVVQIGNNDESDILHETRISHLMVANTQKAGNGIQINFIYGSDIETLCLTNGGESTQITMAQFSRLKVASFGGTTSLHLTAGNGAGGAVIDNTFIAVNIGAPPRQEQEGTGLVIDDGNVTGNTFISPTIGDIATAINSTAGARNKLVGLSGTFVGTWFASGGAVGIDATGYAAGALTAPAVPASGTALANPFGVDCTVAVTDSGTGTSVAVGGITVATIAAGATVPVRVGAGQSITLTYSTTPTWAWTGH